MTTTHRNHPRPPKGTSSVQPRRATGTTDTAEARMRTGNKQSSTSAAKPASILKRPRHDKLSGNRFNEHGNDWHQPNNLDLGPMKPTSSPMNTPPRLRTLMTPPGVEPYRNSYNLRRLTSPLPGLADWNAPPVGLDTWGIDPVDYRVNQDLHLTRRYPSPISRYGLSNGISKHKKSYIVVPRLTHLMSPSLGRDGGTFTLPSRRPYSDYVPDSQYSYLERVRSHPSMYLHPDPSDYIHVRRNDALANSFIEQFIGKCIQDQFIPDLLLEIISELDQENKKEGEKSQKQQVERHRKQLNHLLSQPDNDNAQLFSDNWIRELDYLPASKPAPIVHPIVLVPNPTYYEEIPLDEATIRYTYRDLSLNAQEELLTSVAHELIETEIERMTREAATEALSNKIHNVPTMNDATLEIYRDIESEVIREIARDTAYDVHRSQRHQDDQVQMNAIDKHAQSKLLDTMHLDQLIGRYVHDNGSAVDVDDLARFLDGNVLENLIYQYQTIDQDRSRTIDNYASRKFHLNSFMNMTMDLLLSELSASLIEDMKDLDETERKVF